MNTAKKGADRERKSMAIYERLGFKTQRSSGSHGLWDFIAWSEFTVVFVQVRSARWPSPREMAALSADRMPLNCQREVHRWKDRGRKPDVKIWNGREWRPDGKS